jgi:hypothetical protein
MLTPEKPPRWLRQFESAVRLNANDLDLWRLVDAPGGSLHDGWWRDGIELVELAEAAAKLVRQTCKYRFEGQRHRVLELAACRRRGWAACADGSAAIAAVLLMAGAGCAICYERACPADGYAHVRVAIGSHFVDAFPEFSLDVPSCAAVLQVTRRSVRWPATAEETARTILDGSRRADGPPPSPEGSTT